MKKLGHAMYPIIPLAVALVLAFARSDADAFVFEGGKKDQENKKKGGDGKKGDGNQKDDDKKDGGKKKDDDGKKGDGKKKDDDGKKGDGKKKDDDKKDGGKKKDDDGKKGDGKKKDDDKKDGGKKKDDAGKKGDGKDNKAGPFFWYGYYLKGDSTFHAMPGFSPNPETIRNEAIEKMRSNRNIESIQMYRSDTLQLKNNPQPAGGFDRNFLKK